MRLQPHLQLRYASLLNGLHALLHGIVGIEHERTHFLVHEAALPQNLDDPRLLPNPHNAYTHA
jgi:hypothetical protein